MKKCFKCGAEKPLSEYYKHPKMADGHVNKCKECNKLDVRTHRKENESVREYDRLRGNRQTKEDLARYRQENPNKYNAHRLISRLVKSGLIQKLTSCEICLDQGGKKGLHGHHDDYSKPETVRWLCAKCHHRWHAVNGEALNP